tara:strand:- start:365 stop:787 length:423 start_codon:yes stop_codon:yes gene_type:complete
MTKTDKVISLPKEIYEKAMLHKEFMDSYCEELGSTMEQMDEGGWGDKLDCTPQRYSFMDWFDEQWEGKAYEGWDEYVPTPDEFMEFEQLLDSKYKIVPHYKWEIEKNYLAVEYCWEDPSSDFCFPEYQLKAYPLIMKISN